MNSRARNFIIYKMIIIVILLGLIVGAVFYQLRLAGEGDTEITTQEIKGQIVAQTEQTISLRNDQNIIYTIDYQKAKINGDSLQYGNQVTVQYTGKLDENIEIQDIDVLKLTVQAIQVRNGGTSNTDPTIASKEIATMVEKMSLEQKVAQLFLVQCPEDSELELLKQYQIGGYILGDQDFKNRSREEVIENIQTYQDNASIPLLIAVNEEGGEVVSISNHLRSKAFRSPQAVFSSGGIDAIISDTTEKAEFLKAFGINVNLAPVADVPTSVEDFIYKRSFDLDVNETSEFVRNVVKATNDLKVGSVLKHFPGYGNAPDTQDMIFHDTRDFDTIKNNDFLPFKAGIEAGANAILVGHNVIDSVDDQAPASLSLSIHDILRKDLNYQGVIMSDDLCKGSARAFGTARQVSVMAIQAGNDLIYSENPQEHIDAAIVAAKNNEICLNSLEHSVMRILTWKSQLGLM